MRGDPIFGERLQRAMGWRGVTQIELHNRTGLHVDTLRRYMTDGRAPRSHTIRDIARALHVSCDWLCGMDDPLPFPERP